MNMQRCSRCKKHFAVVFVTKFEGEKVTNEGLCLKCAKELGIKPANIPIDSIDVSDEALEEIDSKFESMMEMMDDINLNEINPDDPNFGGGFDFLKNLMPSAEPRSENAIEKVPDKNRDSVGKGTEKKSRKKDRPQTRMLDNYCTNLTAKARDGKLDAVIGREKEILRAMQILTRRNKNNPCLIGEPGVGKTAIAEGIAQRIIKGDVPAKIAEKEIYLLDLMALVAGTSFRGQFESRVKGLIDEVKKLGNVILVIDEVHNLVGTGDSEGTMSAANMMKPALSRGEIQVIGATTLTEYRKYIEKDSALERRFQPIIVEEPSISEASEMLMGIKGYYENFHRIKIPSLLIDRAVELSERYVTDRYLPDKAIDLIDEACSNAVLRHPVYNEYFNTEKSLNEIQAQISEIEEKPELEEADYQLITQLKSDAMRLSVRLDELGKEIDKISITIDDLAYVIELWTGIPATKIRQDENNKLMNLETELKERIVGQDKAVEEIAKGVRRGRVGLIPRKRPVSFIFAGPTGVGKTELVKVLANKLFDSPETLIRLDMSEYMEKHSVSKIIGAPPGYVGYDDAGQLTEKIRRKPYSVVLFDEIEKAHPDVLNILLQILDDGRITDARGKTVSFEHTLIVMTSNAGSNTRVTSAGFGKSDYEITEEKVKKALSEFLRPEFLNRVDEIIIFRPLPKELFKDIVRIYVEDLRKALLKKEITFIYDDDVLALLAEKSYSAQYGARNCRRVIQREIEDRAVTAICERTEPVNTITAKAENGEIILDIK